MNNMHRNVSAALADTQFLTNTALQSLLSPLFTKFHTVTSKVALLKLLKSEPVSLLITDHLLFDYPTVTDLGRLIGEHPSMKAVVLTNSITHLKIRELNDCGVRNIVLKTDDREELFHAIDSALKGKKYYSGNVLDILLHKEGPLEDASILTPSEIEIVRMIAGGLSTKEIAAKKFISFHTVMTHRKNIFRKLDVSSSSELLMYAIKAGVIDNIEYHI
jgi:DNA-binding NarL/FixJ family response regulator